MPNEVFTRLRYILDIFESIDDDSHDVFVEFLDFVELLGFACGARTRR